MLLLRLQCGLGNQMFQYAAVRAQAERLGCRFAYTEFPVKWTSHLRLWMTGRRRLLLAPRFELERVFQLNHATHWENQCRLQWFRCRYGLNPRTYREPLAPPRENLRELTRFDPDFFQVKPGCEIHGFFQSEAYFADQRDQVRGWFQPRPDLANLARVAAERTGVEPDRRCCVHVRRGDYLQMRNGGVASGWALPRSYYDRALEQLPSGLRFVIITDDPTWAAAEFAALRPLVYSHTPEAVVDLLIMRHCRVNIIANSSFSWWGAYLNELPERRILYPQDFLGWAFQTELPIGISVADWTAVPVR